MKIHPVIFLSLTAFLLLLAQLCTGSGLIEWRNWSQDPLLALRLWRGIAGFLIGGALSLSGLVCQVVFRNPLASPSILGIASGAAAGAASAFLWCSAALLTWMVPAGAFGGAMLALGLVMLVSRGGQDGADSLLLSGVIVSTMISSLLVYLISIADSQELSGVTWWTLGDLQAVPPSGLAMLFFMACAAVVFLRANANGLNALSLGEEEAAALGVSVRRLQLLLIVLAAILASYCVSLAGIISFVGLIVPHLVRRLFGCDLRNTLAVTFLFGGVFLQGCDLISKLFGRVRQLPIGVMTACLGGALFIVLLKKRRRL